MARFLLIAVDFGDFSSPRCPAQDFRSLEIALSPTSCQEPKRIFRLVRQRWVVEDSFKFTTGVPEWE